MDICARVEDGSSSRIMSSACSSICANNFCGIKHSTKLFSSATNNIHIEKRVLVTCTNDINSVRTTKLQNVRIQQRIHFPFSSSRIFGFFSFLPWQFTIPFLTNRIDLASDFRPARISEKVRYRRVERCVHCTQIFSNAFPGRSFLDSRAPDEVVSLAKAAIVDTSIRTRFGTQFHEREYLLVFRVAVGLTSR